MLTIFKSINLILFFTIICIYLSISLHAEEGKEKNFIPINVKISTRYASEAEEPQNRSFIQLLVIFYKALKHKKTRKPLSFAESILVTIINFFNSLAKEIKEAMSETNHKEKESSEEATGVVPQAI